MYEFCCIWYSFSYTDIMFQSKTNAPCLNCYISSINIILISIAFDALSSFFYSHRSSSSILESSRWFLLLKLRKLTVNSIRKSFSSNGIIATSNRLQRIMRRKCTQFIFFKLKMFAFREFTHYPLFYSFFVVPSSSIDVNIIKSKRKNENISMIQCTCHDLYIPTNLFTMYKPLL